MKSLFRGLLVLMLVVPVKTSFGFTIPDDAKSKTELTFGIDHPAVEITVADVSVSNELISPIVFTDECLKTCSAADCKIDTVFLVQSNFSNVRSLIIEDIPDLSLKRNYTLRNFATLHKPCFVLEKPAWNTEFRIRNS